MFAYPLRLTSSPRLPLPPIPLLATTALTHAQKSSGVTTSVHFVLPRPEELGTTGVVHFKNLCKQLHENAG